MAPNRKKKKPINPMRGFATTSTPTKSKLVEELDSDLIPKSSALDADVLESLENGAKLTVASRPEEEVHEFGPEELENHLEQSALEILHEKHGESSRKDVTRQVNKLQTEQRILRLQSEYLGTSSWLPEKTIQLIFDLIEYQDSSRSIDVDIDNRRTDYSITEDDLIVKFWTLRQTLLDLGFESDRAQSALLSLLHKQAIRPFASFATKDAIWGLEESLEFLVRTCEPKELPSYEAQSSKILAKQGRKVQRADSGKSNPEIILSFIAFWVAFTCQKKYRLLRDHTSYFTTSITICPNFYAHIKHPTREQPKIWVG